MNGPEFLIPIALFFSVASIVRSVLKHRERKLEIEAQSWGGGRDATVRLERMEQAIDAIAVEVERIAENQRFTTRLLAERGDARQSELLSPPTRR